MREVDFDFETLEQQTPDKGHLLALRDGVGGDETDLDLRVLDILSRTIEPCGDIVDIAGVFELAKRRAPYPRAGLCFDSVSPQTADCRGHSLHCFGGRISFQANRSALPQTMCGDFLSGNRW